MPQLLHGGGRVDPAVPYLIKHTSPLWVRAVKVVLRRASFAQVFIFWDPKRSACCPTQLILVPGLMGVLDLYPNDAFISFEPAQEAFDVGRASFYCKQALWK